MNVHAYASFLLKKKPLVFCTLFVLYNIRKSEDMTCCVAVCAVFVQYHLNSWPFDFRIQFRSRFIMQVGQWIIGETIMSEGLHI